MNNTETFEITSDQLMRAGNLAGHIQTGRQSTGDPTTDKAIVALLESGDNASVLTGLQLAHEKLQLTSKGQRHVDRITGASPGRQEQDMLPEPEARAVLADDESSSDTLSDTSDDASLGATTETDDSLWLDTVATIPVPPSKEIKRVELIAEVLRLVGTDRPLIAALLPEKSQKGLHFFFSSPNARNEMPIEHMKVLLMHLGAARDKYDAQKSVDDAAMLEKDLLIDEIDAILHPEPGRDYEPYFYSRIKKSLKRNVLRRRPLQEIQRILFHIQDLNEVRLREAEERAATRSARQSEVSAKSTDSSLPPGHGVPTWQSKHAGLPTGKPNPQGAPAQVTRRGNVVAHAGKTSQEKSRVKGK